ncbi:MAG: DUF4340 domain-containing protein [Verrucomicrobiota bacterium]|jgi:hypothetical protein
MNARNTFFWLALAAVLFIAILTHQRFGRPPPPGPLKVLPGFKAPAVTSISVQLKGQKLIRAERTNDAWRLTEPVSYPAQPASIESLLLALERLTPAAIITAHERQGSPNSDEEQGFVSPQASLSIQQDNSRIFQLEVGARTAPGDQLYLQVVGVAGVYVVDADLLKEIPRAQDDWRDTALVDLKGLAFDHIALTNRFNNLNDTKVIELQHYPANNLWRIVNPPKDARADANRLGDLLQQLESLRVKEFVSDEPKAELEPFGLQLPQLELALARGTNTLVLLQFGKSPTNDPALVYARRGGRDTIVTVATNALGGWQDQVDAFRATNVIDLPDAIAAIEVFGQDRFSVQQQGSNTWRVLPQNLPADAAACKDLLSALGRMPILEPLDAVNDSEFARYGLAAPTRKYIFKMAAPSASDTNPAIAEVDVGATNDGRVFVRRADEKSSAYAVKLADVQRLPVASFQMRERQIWNYSDDDLARVTVRYQGKVRQLVHTDNGRQSWALPPGSTGAIEALAVGETMHNLAQLTATNWVAHGLQSRAPYGFSDNSGQITLELKNGAKPFVELGGPSPAKSLYGAVTLDGEPWVFEFHPWLAQWIQTFLLPPP